MAKVKRFKPASKSYIWAVERRYKYFKDYRKYGWFFVCPRNTRDEARKTAKHLDKEASLCYHRVVKYVRED